MCELELQKINSVDKVDRLRKETLELEKHIAMLDRSVSHFPDRDTFFLPAYTPTIPFNFELHFWPLLVSE